MLEAIFEIAHINTAIGPDILAFAEGLAVEIGSTEDIVIREEV
jgi:hypothetical protein